MMTMMAMTILPSKPPLLAFLLAFSILVLVSSSLSILDFHRKTSLPKSIPQFSHNKTTPAPQPGPNPHETTPPVITPNNIAPSDHHQNQTRVEPEKHSINTTTTSTTMRCNENRALLRVYMYDLPPRFHFGLLGWNGGPNQTWPDIIDMKRIPSYPGGLNLQHSAEYWLTLDILSSNTDDIIRPCTAIRVMDSSKADIIFVPFFSSLSYNRHSKRHARDTGDRSLQDRLVKFLYSRREWKRSKGRDHLVVAHHPNSMLFARRRLASSRFLLSDFGRYSARVANLKKDVIAPYKHMVRTVAKDSSLSFEERTTLAYFQGAIYRKDGGSIRKDLYRLLRNERDVHFASGSAQRNSVREAGKGMSSSKFCLNIAGDTPSSNRLFDAIATHCVPVVISDEIELPFEDVLDYSQFCVFVRASDAVKKGHLLKVLRGMSREKWTEMWEKLKEISGHFEYQYPSRSGDAVDMIWQAVARKKAPTGRLSLHRKNRYSKSQFR